MKMMCKDWPDRPGCLGETDPRFTMRFDDIGKPPIHWCAHCGPEAHEMNKILKAAFDERGPEFVQEFAAAIDRAKPTEH